MKNIITSVILVALCVFLNACRSPLDPAIPRNTDPLTPAKPFPPSLVVFDSISNLGGATMALDPQSTFLIDTSKAVIHVSGKFTIFCGPITVSPNFIVNKITVNFDSLPCSSNYTPLQSQPVFQTGIVCYANFAFAEVTINQQGTVSYNDTLELMGTTPNNTASVRITNAGTTNSMPLLSKEILIDYTAAVSTTNINSTNQATSISGTIRLKY